MQWVRWSKSNASWSSLTTSHGPLVVWGPTVVCGCAPNNRARETEGGEGDGEA